MKRIINSDYMKWFRKRYLRYIYKQIRLGNEHFCCHVKCVYSLFICWKDLKEVKENMNSELISSLLKSNLTCSRSWFRYRHERLEFLQECLNKF